MMKIIPLNITYLPSKKQGFNVRIQRDEKGIIKKCDYGVIIKEGRKDEPDVFMGIPFHNAGLPETVPSPAPGTAEPNIEYRIPALDLDWRVIRTKFRSGKIVPMLVPQDPSKPVPALACLALQLLGRDKIIHVRTPNTVVRHYIDKDRQLVGIMILCDNADLGGFIDVDAYNAITKSIVTTRYKFHEFSPNWTSSVESIQENVPTCPKSEFINFNKQFIPKVKTAKPTLSK